MQINRAFGKALQRIRQSKGLTQEDFSLVSSRTYMSTLERGLKSPTLDKVQQISKRLGVHPLTLLASAYAIAQGTSDPAGALEVTVSEIKALD